MKKLFSILLAIALLASFMVLSVSAAGTSVSVSDASGETGESVVVNVSILGNPGFASGKVTLSYDTAALELVALEGVMFKGNVNVSGGMANHYLGVVTGDGILVKATFKILAASGEYTVSASVSGMRTADGTTIEVTGGEGTVSVIVPECEHSWDAGVVTTEPGCETEGVKTYTCSKCGETKTESIPAKGHSFGEWTETKAPTCTEKGEETRKCACGETETREVAAKGHTFGEWTETKAPTCTEKGEETRKCACGETETREVAAKGHALSKEHDADNHWDVCDNCDYVGEKEAHSFENNGYCECGYKNPVEETPDDPDLDDVPKTGDITALVTMITVIALGMIAAVLAAVLKRKTIK